MLGTVAKFSRVLSKETIYVSIVHCACTLSHSVRLRWPNLAYDPHLHHVSVEQVPT